MIKLRFDTGRAERKFFCLSLDESVGCFPEDWLLAWLIDWGCVKLHIFILLLVDILWKLSQKRSISKKPLFKRDNLPKNKKCWHLLMLMSFQICVSFFLLLNTKEDILKNVDDQTVVGPIDFHSVFPYYASQRDHQLLIGSKWWQHFNFGMNCPFKKTHKQLIRVAGQLADCPDPCLIHSLLCL